MGVDVAIVGCWSVVPAAELFTEATSVGNNSMFPVHASVS